MLIHSWDATLGEDEWQAWLDEGHDFGQLAVNGGAGSPPLIQLTHFVYAGSTLLVHLARANPMWAAIERDPLVLCAVVDGYAYVPTTWRAKAGGPEEDGVPTSYYATVQFTCQAELIDDPEGKAELLRRQLAHFQPAGDHGEVGVDLPPYGRMLPGIRGAVLHVASVVAKFKYDDHNQVEHRQQVTERLEERVAGRDAGAAVQQRRRLGRIGTWQK